MLTTPLESDLATLGRSTVEGSLIESPKSVADAAGFFKDGEDENARDANLRRRCDGDRPSRGGDVSPRYGEPPCRCGERRSDEGPANSAPDPVHCDCGLSSDDIFYSTPDAALPLRGEGVSSTPPIDRSRSSTTKSTKAAILRDAASDFASTRSVDDASQCAFWLCYVQNRFPLHLHHHHHHHHYHHHHHHRLIRRTLSDGAVDDASLKDDSATTGAPLESLVKSEPVDFLRRHPSSLPLDSSEGAEGSPDSAVSALDTPSPLSDVSSGGTPSTDSDSLERRRPTTPSADEGVHSGSEASGELAGAESPGSTRLDDNSLEDAKCCGGVGVCGGVDFPRQEMPRFDVDRSEAKTAFSSSSSNRFICDAMSVKSSHLHRRRKDQLSRPRADAVPDCNASSSRPLAPTSSGVQTASKFGVEISRSLNPANSEPVQSLKPGFRSESDKIQGAPQSFSSTANFIPQQLNLALVELSGSSSTSSPPVSRQISSRRCSESSTTSSTQLSSSVGNSAAFTGLGFQFNVRNNQVLCRWDDCNFECCDNAALLEHLRNQHVDPQLHSAESKKASPSSDSSRFVCKWMGCKVFDRPASSFSWLERHYVSHAGANAFKCMIGKCFKRFNSQMALQRHVNMHFKDSLASDMENPDNAHHSRGEGAPTGARSRDATPTKIGAKKKKLIRVRLKRVVQFEDFMDTHTVEVLKHRLVRMDTFFRKRSLSSDEGEKDHLRSLRRCKVLKADDETIEDELIGNEQRDSPPKVMGQRKIHDEREVLLSTDLHIGLHHWVKADSATDKTSHPNFDSIRAFDHRDLGSLLDLSGERRPGFDHVLDSAAPKRISRFTMADNSFPLEIYRRHRFRPSRRK